MKNKRLWVALAALALALCAATVVYGDYNVMDKGTHYTNSSTGLRTNSTGVLLTQENLPQQEFVINNPLWFQTTLRSRDSTRTAPYFVPGTVPQDSAFADVHGCNGIAVTLYPTFQDTSAGLTSVIIAMQVRWHNSLSPDSMSTFIDTWTTNSATFAARDTIGTTLMQQAYPSGRIPNVYATPDETVIVFTNIGTENRGRIIRITPPRTTGIWSAGPYMSVRLRYLQSYGGTDAHWLGRAGDRNITLRVGLMGWR